MRSNKLSELSKILQGFNIKEVEYKKLGDVVLFNKHKQISAKEIEKLKVDGGNIPLLPSSANYDWYTTKEKARDKIVNGNVITLGRARHPNLKKAMGDFVSANNIIIQSQDENKLSFKFLYYFIDINKYKFYIETSTYPKFDKDIFSKTEIPIPPLDAQNKIVEILDSFTNYKAELTAELTVRIKQYEYYRDKLLDFKDKDVEYKKLGDVVLFNKHKQISAKEIEKLKVDGGNIPLLPSSANYDWYTTKEKARDKIVNGNVITLGRARHPNLKKAMGDFVSANNIIIQSQDENKLSFKFLYYFIDINKYKFYIETSTYPKFDKDIFSKTEIPIPPLDAQNKIVEILDSFSYLVNEISDGLPKEIELRNKQYEYYRDLLLSFKGNYE